MAEKAKKNHLTILRILQGADRPLSSSRILENLQAMGLDMSERTVRHYLLEMDSKGFTRTVGKKGRLITDLGVQETETAQIIERVGFLTSRIDQLTYRMTLDVKSRTGTVIVNMSLLTFDQIVKSVELIGRVFSAGYSMGSLIGLFGPGERFGDTVIPKGTVGVATVCSITLNGALLSHGIPVHSVFGGLLEMQKRKPSRFVEIIRYDGTSIDPLEVFIRSGMTDYLGATSTGNGRIGVGFREVPAESRDRVIQLADTLNEVGLGGFLTIGWPGQPLLEIPVGEGRVGLIVIGGLNPIAILEESGIRAKSRALAGSVEYESLFHFAKLGDRVNEVLKKAKA